MCVNDLILGINSSRAKMRKTPKYRGVASVIRVCVCGQEMCVLLRNSEAPHLCVAQADMQRSGKFSTVGEVC